MFALSEQKQACLHPSSDRASRAIDCLPWVPVRLADRPISDCPDREPRFCFSLVQPKAPAFWVVTRFKRDRLVMRVAISS